MHIHPAHSPTHATPSRTLTHTHSHTRTHHRPASQYRPSAVLGARRVCCGTLGRPCHASAPRPQQWTEDPRGPRHRQTAAVAAAHGPSPRSHCHHQHRRHHCCGLSATVAVAVAAAAVVVVVVFSVQSDRVPIASAARVRPAGGAALQRGHARPRPHGAEEGGVRGVCVCVCVCVCHSLTHSLTPTHIHTESAHVPHLLDLCLHSEPPLQPSGNVVVKRREHSLVDDVTIGSASTVAR